ncbi:hypothetical protein U1Q18_009058 [Sarracenia purpurea var. burkii]
MTTAAIYRNRAPSSIRPMTPPRRLFSSPSSLRLRSLTGGFLGPYVDSERESGDERHRLNSLDLLLDPEKLALQVLKIVLHVLLPNVGELERAREGWGRPKRSSSSKATDDWSPPCGSYFTNRNDGVAQTRVLGRAPLQTLPLFARPSPILALESA